MSSQDSEAQAKRRAKIASVLANSSGRTNGELLRLTDTPEQRASLGLVADPIVYIKSVEEYVGATVARLEVISRQLWGEQVPEPLGLRTIINYRDTDSGRSNAGNFSSTWRSQTLTHLLPEGLCINLNAIWRSMHQGEFIEYRFIRLDPHIGTIKTASWQEYIEVLLSHEFAHILDLVGIRCPVNGFPEYSKNRVKGHHYNWQCLYRNLRIAMGRVRIASAAPDAIQQATFDAAHNCLHCDGPILSIRSDAKFCSTKCRIRHRRAKF